MITAISVSPPCGQQVGGAPTGAIGPNTPIASHLQRGLGALRISDRRRRRERRASAVVLPARRHHRRSRCTTGRLQLLAHLAVLLDQQSDDGEDNRYHRQLGPELSCDDFGCQTSSLYVGHLDDARGDQWFNVTTQLAPSSTTPVFTTVNVHVVYTDADGAQARTIDRSLTFAVKYAAPPPSLNIAAAAAVGLGGAGVLGIGLYAMRRARLEELYLMHDSGMLIRHWSRKQGIVHDSDIMSGMLIILQEFVRDSFDDRRGTLEQLRFGQRQVIMVRGEHTVLAAVIEGRYVNGLPRKLQLSVWEFERSHSDTLAKWDGNVALLPQADAIAQRFIRPRLRLHPS